MPIVFTITPLQPVYSGLVAASPNPLAPDILPEEIADDLRAALEETEGVLDDLSERRKRVALPPRA